MPVTEITSGTGRPSRVPTIGATGASHHRDHTRNGGMWQANHQCSNDRLRRIRAARQNSRQSEIEPTGCEDRARARAARSAGVRKAQSLATISPQSEQREELRDARHPAPPSRASGGRISNVAPMAPAISRQDAEALMPPHTAEERTKERREEQRRVRSCPGCAATTPDQRTTAIRIKVTAEGFCGEKKSMNAAASPARTGQHARRRDRHSRAERCGR